MKFPRQRARVSLVCLLLLVLTGRGLFAQTVAAPTTTTQIPAGAVASSDPAKPGSQTTPGNSPAPSVPNAIQQSSPDQAPSPSEKTPSGVAVAPEVPVRGVPASRPAGGSIAPAKQRRIRTWSIRIAILVGIGVAIGAVAAASAGSPSNPH